ncbi:4-hydroxybutyrate coenzyme A transferase [Echinococcus granulosus]|uniref:4-hydroxybutyrate coenzyme A transferase n=1 Tax=Echinococcus granulosus TaxID=6210 RepID=U6JE41_ECHGR|nr:4-hydroxybutyrate coenzyme A transferase [Echinococcus granulosus]EUB59502.1 4-hydroxybutyrate coenzyme A transferase [Echinococcus granulosus]KAH9284543.1 4-hydroxybutyrate coenzyme A transferase [Echinococcus granulosus]CDS21616.1 4 Hydroxybutyrate coenzyme A transferase [Echinococcus granulosus]
MLVSALSKSYGLMFPSFRRFASLDTVKISWMPGLQEPNAPIPGRHPIWSETSSEIFKDLKSGDSIFVHGASGTPGVLLSFLYQHVKSTDLKNLNVLSLLPMAPLGSLIDDIRDKLRLTTPLANKYCREAVNDGRADFIPISVSEMPLLYRQKHVNLDYALISVTPPDKHGFCSLGTFVGTARSAIQSAKRIIAQVNPMQPVTYGDSTIHVSKIDYLVNGPQQLLETSWKAISPMERKVANIIADNLVDDGATLQLSPSNISQQLTTQLRSHKDLGIHTECFGDGEIDLVHLGVINNRLKAIHRGRIVASYVIGTKKTFNFINENPLVALYDIAWVNAPELIALNPKVTAINHAFEMDLSGQSSSDGYDGQIYTGVGGVIDFLRGASIASDGAGKPVIAMTSLNDEGKSTIVPFLSRGTTVVATRAHVHYVVTEYGIAYLFGKNLRQRAHALIQIAHPDFRESLEKAAFDRLKCMPSP